MFIKILDELPVTLECKVQINYIIMLLISKTDASIYKLIPSESTTGKFEISRIAGVKLNSTVKKFSLIKDNTCLYDVAFMCGALLSCDDEEDILAEQSLSPLISGREHVDTTVVVKTEKVEKIEAPEGYKQDRSERNEENFQSNVSHFQGSSALCVTATYGSIVKLKRTMPGVSKKSLGIYLADTKGYIHIYRVNNY